MVREDSPKYLVAYVVPCTWEDIDDPDFVSELSHFVAQQLPSFMIPKFIVLLSQIPLNQNGKVNRDLLPPPTKETSGRSNQLPERALLRHLILSIQGQLTKIFSRLLNLTQVDASDDFFKLGGNSLSVFQLLREIRSVYPWNVSVPDIYKNPTVYSMASHLLNMILNNSSSQEIFEISPPQPNKKCLFLFPPASGIVLPYIGLSDVTVVSISAVCNPYVGTPNKFPSMDDMAAYFFSQVKKHQPTGPYLIGGWSFGGFFALEVSSKLQNSGEIVERVILFDAINNDLLPPVNVTQTWVSMEKDAPSLSEKEKEALLIMENENVKYLPLLESHKIKPYTGPTTLFKASLQTYHETHSSSPEHTSIYEIINQSWKNIHEAPSNGLKQWYQRRVLFFFFFFFFFSYAEKK
eukprot:TRINITY_DN7854_c0_g1_i6.p1 TRINITY_DN7854_c0_g1~~TRINITY_DN7854_c0_g1_i6.p1  ORF type:complete len:407 (+),score=89.39 TRINITY_DN7854_c0_g1_i6:273-1493(+)